MKKFALLSAVLALGFTLAINDAEAARRMGSGKSMGMQREAVSPQRQNNVAPPQAPAAPNQATAPMAAKQPAAAAPQAQPKRSWMGPLAGLAAGLGLAALASHFGFGEELASMLMLGLLVMVVLMVVGFLMRKKAAAQQPALAGAGGPGMQYAGGSQDFQRDSSRDDRPVSAFQPAGTPVGGTVAGSRIPADFDVEGFVRNAKVNFIRLQAANDAGNLDDLREFTTPEMFAELKLDIDARRGARQETDVQSVEAEVLDVAEEASRYIVSVRFHGLIREERDGPAEAFDEVWHMTKPLDGGRGWVIAGIQQVQ